MRGILLYLFGALSGAVFLLGAGSQVTSGLSPATFEQRMRADAAPTVRMMLGDNGGCSAVVIAPGYAFTALHCKAAINPKVDGHAVAKWREYSAKDVAIIEVPGLACPCATVASAPLAGERIASIGFPHSVGLLISYGESQGDVFVDKERYLHHTAPVESGMSGGGVFVLRAGKILLVAITSRGSQAGGSVLAIAVEGLQPQLKAL